MKLFAYAAVLALGYYTIRQDWLALGSVDVKGNSRLTRDEVVRLAALNDPCGVWAIALPCDLIRKGLESNPLIESASVRLTGPTSIGIRIRERQPVAAVEINGHRMVFDRTGGLMNILRPADVYMGRIVKGVPPGLLNIAGTPIYSLSPCCGVPQDEEKRKTLETQFNRVIQLLDYMSADSLDFSRELECVSMDDAGCISAKFKGLPPVLFGQLDYPDRQLRHLTGILENPSIADPHRVSDIDLSSVLFPCLHATRPPAQTPITVSQPQTVKPTATSPASKNNAHSTLSTYQGDLNFFALGKTDGKGH